MAEFTQKVIAKSLYEERAKILKNNQNSDTIDELLLRVIRAPHRKIYLSGEDYRRIRDALNEFRNDLLATGHYTDGVDETMIKLLKAPYRKCREK